MLAFFVCIIYLIKELKKSYQTFLFFSKVLLACLANQGLSLSSLHCISTVTLMHRDLFSSCSNQVPFPVWDSSLEGIGFFFLSLYLLPFQRMALSGLLVFKSSSGSSCE